MRRRAREAETIGIDAVFVADMSGVDVEGEHSLETWDGWTLLPALAEATSRAAIGSLVANPLLRHPVAFARMAAALDEVSGGRLILGLGASDAGERAVRVLGVPPRRLYSRFEEAVNIIVPLLREGSVDVQGEFFEAHEAVLGPKGPRGGSVPIWIAAGGPKMTRLAARWADAVNFQRPLTEPDEARAGVIRFEEVCREVGREPTTVEKTGWAIVSFRENGPWPFAIAGEPEMIAARLSALHDAGISHVSCYIDGGDEPDQRNMFPLLTARGLERFAEVIAALREMERGT